MLLNVIAKRGQRNELLSHAPFGATLEALTCLDIDLEARKSGRTRTSQQKYPKP